LKQLETIELFRAVGLALEEVALRPDPEIN
jgi:hypothetical protein